MGEILVKALSLVLIIVIGYMIKQIGWVSKEDFPKFSKVVLRLTLPCALISSFNNFSITYNLLFLTAIGFVANLLQQVASYFLNRKKSRAEQAFGIINGSSYNVGAFAIPYISGFLGSQPIVYALLFDIGNSFSFAGFGYGWAMSTANDKVRATPVRFLKNMLLSPVFDTYLLIMFLQIFHLRLPDAILTFTQTVGNANPFLAMLMIGIGLELHLDPDKGKRAFYYLAVRYGFALLFTVLAYFTLPVSREIKTILCMLFFSPIAVVCSAFTNDTKGDVELSTFMISVSILIGIVAMPSIFMLMGS